MLQFILSLLIKLSSKSMSQLKTYNDTSETRGRRGGGALQNHFSHIIMAGPIIYLLLWGRISVKSRKIFRISTITHALKEFLPCVPLPLKILHSLLVSTNSTHIESVLKKCAFVIKQALLNQLSSMLWHKIFSCSSLD